MLTGTTNKRICSLMGLLAILYITIGLPLIHLEVHESFAHDHQIVGCCINHSQQILIAPENHDCAICDFLSTSPLHNTLSVSFPVTDAPFANFASIFPSNIETAFLSSNGPRAPPAVSLNRASFPTPWVPFGNKI